MTTVDTTVYHYPVLMELTKFPKLTYQLAKGYHIRPFEMRYMEQWIQLNVELKQMESYEAGKAYVEKTFLPKQDLLSKQILIIVDEKDHVVATASVWEGFHYGERRMRLHWVGVSQKHQRKGLARCIVLACIQLYLDMHLSTPLYLSSQTNSYVAIKMYEDLGFTPYFKECPKTFDVCFDTYEEDNRKAWDFIHQKIAELD